MVLPIKEYIYCNTLLLEITVFSPNYYFFNSNLHYEANLIRLEGFGFYEILQADVPLGHSTRTKILKKQFSKLDVKSISLAYDRLDKMNS